MKTFFSLSLMIWNARTSANFCVSKKYDVYRMVPDRILQYF
jgi:hypothetical protein